jgi:hypothetical protein
MRHLIAILLGLTLATATTAVAQTTSTQAPDWKQTLGGLLNGNQDRDDAIRQAYERGYQRGRNDEARQQGTREPRNNPYDDRGGYYRGR